MYKHIHVYMFTYQYMCAYICDMYTCIYIYIHTNIDTPRVLDVYQKLTLHSTHNALYVYDMESMNPQAHAHAFI